MLVTLAFTQYDYYPERANSQDVRFTMKHPYTHFALDIERMSQPRTKVVAAALNKAGPLDTG